MTGMFQALAIVYRKELVDGVRDRRSILSGLLPIALVPLMVTFIQWKTVETAESAQSVTVTVAGAEHGRELVDWLSRQRGVTVEETDADPEADVRAGKLGFALAIAEDFGERFSQFRSADVSVLVDGADQKAAQEAERLRDLLDAYSTQVARQRLIARGVTPEVTLPLRTKNLDLATTKERSALAFSFVPLLLVMGVFLGGLQIAIDSTAGERERLSLEPLLLNSAPRLSILAGKWLAAVTFSTVSVALTLAALVVVLNRSPLRRVGFDPDLASAEIAAMLAVVLPLALVAAVTETLIATASRSYKEAQTYVSLLMMVPMLPVLLTVGSSGEPQPWTYAVPVLGQYQMLMSTLKGTGISAAHYAIAAGIAVLLSAAGLAFNSWLLRRERVVFGR